MRSLVPHLIGIDTRHSPDFKIDRPRDPSGFVLCMCFRTRGAILTVDGLVELIPGDCIVHDPEFRQIHYSSPGSTEGFRNDWFHVAPTVACPVMTRLGLPWNKLIRTGRGDIFEPYMKLLLREIERADEHSDIQVEAILLSMLLEASRAAKEAALLRETMSFSERRHFERMSSLRSRMLERFREPCDVRSLAKEANLSPERFSALYRRFFGRPPIAELIDARTLAAKRALAYSYSSVKEIAQASGFEDLHYFSRLFKKRTGMAPSDYRAKHMRLSP